MLAAIALVISLPASARAKGIVRLQACGHNAKVPLPEALSRDAARGRWVSAGEALLCVFVVLGHNVWGFLPNEVPILLVLGWVSLQLRDGGWRAVGVRRPGSWIKTLLLALAAAAALQLVSEFVAGPVSAALWHRPPDLSSFRSLAGNLRNAAVGFLVIWTFAAFGEEMVYRGYLLTRLADLGARASWAYWIALPFASVLFGFGHFYQGPAGVVDATCSGLVLGAAYLLSGRNLWVANLAHGISDTFALVVVYLGLATNG